jgi:hypothetical protein
MPGRMNIRPGIFACRNAFPDGEQRLNLLLPAASGLSINGPRPAYGAAGPWAVGDQAASVTTTFDLALGFQPVHFLQNVERVRGDQGVLVFPERQARCP